MEDLLIIDDSKTVRDALKRALEDSVVFRGFFAESFASAKELIEEHKFHIAIVDLELPDCKSGEAVELTLNSGISTIVLTGTLNNELRDKILSLNVSDYIYKNSLEDINSAIYSAENLLLFRDLRVLIVDDSKVARVMLKKHFDALGFESFEASSPKEALEILKNDNSFSVVTIDQEMPEINGVELLQKLRSIRFQTQPIFFGVFGSSDEKIKFGFLKNGASEVFSKPFIKEELSAKLANTIRLRKKESELARYVDTVDKYVISSMTDIEGKIVYTSTAFCEVSGYSKEELIGENHRIVRHSDMPKELYEDLWKTITNNQKWEGEIKNRKKDGGFYWVKAFIEPVLNTKNEIIGYTAIRQNITDKKIIEEISITDGLTNIYNRRHFNDTFPKIIESANDELVCFLLMDIDHFKQYNDNYGHQKGDDVLIEFAASIKNSLRGGGDIAFRLGGEEFGAIFKANNKDEALLFANKIRENIESLKIVHDYSSASKYVSASMGLVCKKGSLIDSMDEVYKEADELLYKSKESGRNRVSVN